MKKTMLFLVAMCIAIAANAKILRVSNVSGSSAPYASFSAAYEVAENNDTIMFDASSVSYGDFEISKSLVLIGPGYWLTTNKIIEEGSETAELGTVTVLSEGCVFKGLTLGIVIRANKTIVNRCYIKKLTLRNASNSIIHQNFIRTSVEGYGSDYQESYLQITNNIIFGRISNLTNAYIAYNILKWGWSFALKDCTIEYNICSREFESSNGNNVSNNLVSGAYYKLLESLGTVVDRSFYDAELDEESKNTYGAFAGDSPYILSGVPSGPVIQDLVVPTTVEMGTKMNVTIKVRMVK